MTESSKTTQAFEFPDECSTTRCTDDPTCVVVVIDWETRTHKTYAYCPGCAHEAVEAAAQAPK